MVQSTILGGSMNIKDESINVLSEHYFNKFSEHLNNNDHKDAMAIMQEYVCNYEANELEYEWLFLPYLNSIAS